MSEKLCLKWNEFQESINNSFTNLRKDETFSDVTLVCEDGQQIEAHKLIISASSPFFLNLLKGNKHPHPLVYMRGVTSKVLVAMVDFFYNGEANVSQDCLDDFLSLAGELELRGLSENEETLKPNITRSRRLKVDSNQQQTNVAQQEIEAKLNEPTDIIDQIETTAQKLNQTREFAELDEQVKSLMTKSENMVKVGSNMVSAHSCSLCGKEAVANVIKDHIETNHLEGVIIPCNLCDKTFSSRNAFRVHKSRNHKHT